MDYRFHNRLSDPSTLWILRENDPRSNATSVVALQITSEPPDNHQWKVVPGTEAVVPRSDLLESYKHHDVIE
jgi:hypothetical protein